VRRTAAPASAGNRGAARPERPSSRVITGLWAAVVLAAIAAVAMTVVARGDLATGDLASNLLLTVAVVAYATLGAVIVRRAGNVIGWIMLGEGAGLAFLVLASMYAVIGVVTFPGSLPAAKQVGTLSECSFSAVVFTLAFMFLLFPTGRLPSRRWRPVAAAGLLLAALTTAGLVVHPRLVHLPAPGGVSLIFPNPLAVPGLGPVLRTVLVGTINGLTAVSVLFLAAALVSLAVRYRAGGRLLRQQIKWLVLTAVGFVVGLFIALLGVAAGQAWLATVAYTSVQIISLLAIPAAMAIAILRSDTPGFRLSNHGRPGRVMVWLCGRADVAVRRCWAAWVWSWSCGLCGPGGVGPCGGDTDRPTQASAKGSSSPPMIGRRSSASSSFVLAAARLRALTPPTRRPAPPAARKIQETVQPGCNPQPPGQPLTPS
jgi:hypothetical protein